MSIHARLAAVTLQDDSALNADRDGALELLANGVVFQPHGGLLPTFIPLSEIKSAVYAERHEPA